MQATLESNSINYHKLSYRKLLPCSLALIPCFYSFFIFESEQLLAADIVTDRPDQTESSSAVGSGVIQIEFGWSHTYNKSDAAKERVNEFPQALARIGLKPGIELRIGWDGYAFDNPSSALGDSFEGAGDASIGAKIDLWAESGSTPESALLFDFSIPLGSDSFTSDRVNPSARISLSNQLSERFSLGYNFGFTTSTGLSPSGSSETSISGLYTVAVGAGLTQRFGAFVEVFGEKRIDEDSAPIHSLDGGLTALFGENYQIDVASGVGLSSGASDWFITAGLSLRIPKQ